MRRNIIIGLLCLALFLAAYIGGTVTTSPRTISYRNSEATERADTGQPRMFLCGGGDEGGGGRPGICSPNGTGV